MGRRARRGRSLGERERESAPGCERRAWPRASAPLSGLFQMKTGPFAEHSNQLWNISAVPSWSKVNQGLIRMYKAEVSAVGSGGLAQPRLLLAVHVPAAVSPRVSSSLLPRAPLCGGPITPSGCSLLNVAWGPLAV